MALALAGSVQGLDRSSQGVVGGSVSTERGQRNKGIGLQLGFLQRFGHLGIGGEADYVRVAHSGSPADNILLVLANAELYLLDNETHDVSPYATFGLGLYSRDPGSGFLWAWGLGAQYNLNRSSASSIFLQIRWQKGTDTERFRWQGTVGFSDFRLTLITAGYRIGF